VSRCRPTYKKRGQTPFALLAAAWLVAIFLAVYGPAVGEGLIADDYGWIVNGLPAADGDIIDPFTRNVGFYRPIVTLSFAANYKVSGLYAKPFGATNLALALACAALIGWLVRLHGLPDGFAVLAAGLWLFNFHGINMAVLWASGRTSLLLTVFSLLAAIAFVKRRTAPAALFCLLAMFSKEEAVILPALFSLWSLIDREAAEADLKVGATYLKRVGAT
jgi:hypothetical protein